MARAAVLLTAALLIQDPADFPKWKELTVAKIGTPTVWSPEGKHLLGASGKRKNKGRIESWDVGAKTETGRSADGQVELMGGSYRLLASAPDRVVALGISKLNQPVIEMFEGKKLEPLRTFTITERLTQAHAMRLSPDGVWLAVTDGSGIIALADTDIAQVRFFLDEIVLGPGSFRSMTFDPKSERMAIGWGAKMHLWDLKAKQVVRSLGLDAESTVTAFSPDGAQLAVGSTRQEIELWATATGAREGKLEGLKGAPTALVYAPSGGWLLSAEKSGPVRFWDLAKKEAAHAMDPGGDTVSALEFSPDGKRLMVGGEKARVWGIK